MELNGRSHRLAAGLVYTGWCFIVPALAEPVQEASLTNQLRGGLHDVHRLIVDEEAGASECGSTERIVLTTQPAGVLPAADDDAGDRVVPARATVYTSRVIASDFPFNEVVPSWNVDVPDGAGFHVEVRVGRTGRVSGPAQETGPEPAGRRDEPGAGVQWTPWYYLGCWGVVSPEIPKTIRDDQGVVDVDYLRSRELFDRLQYRVYLYSPDANQTPVLRRFGLVYSHTLNDVAVAGQHRETVEPVARDRWARRLPVPFRSQKVEDESIRGSICSPTSTAMVMAYHGVERPTRLMADIIYDSEYRIYGNWARAVQGAWLFGVPGHIERFSDWESVKRHIANDQPIIASIKVPRGTLRGAPYQSSNGHLLVVVGFDEEGNIHVNDPAGETSAAGLVTYAREDMETVWFGRGGIGYVLTPPDRSEGSE